ncbi:RTA-like protein [Aspergillus karnatakaensis]|uniref:RTA1 domain-containing protein n=1 Tax=Aspergillus karnatakaensis TaxID=1810916 RepID=UPI003CCE443E
MFTFCIQNVFILLGPALFAASIYMVLGRIIVAVKGEKHSLIRVRWVTKIFVTGDVLSFLIQGGSAGMMVSSDLASLGNKMVVVGLAVQVVMFGLFVITAVVFQVRMQRDLNLAGLGPQGFSGNLRWRVHLNTLYLVSALIMVRSVFRVVEFVMGNDGYLLQHEWPLYVFDAVLMVLVMVVFGARYPSDVFAYSHVHERVVLNEVRGV